ncbi:MAG: (2Fe-2S)-binding protein [Rhodospirillaceae bacterium]|jgi:aerobic carbon-monoxide dehydrogenase small subunit|nr:(2Fe-2S)-binding protein [Rhodospirillaceae bacterium]MBT4588978.1 (2Fe-2S)-binding protein [Rhodospirillaceae bacterium]MBT4940100.1 (2Fe-2S)-binding protein [Rhodospirillaceae bacterium]MBT5941962.1 (2Fe-2S)-binding protein [Rhodospirillaceae bacterium]
MSAKIDIEFTVNGAVKQVTVPATASALDMLRDQLDLKGAKEACGEGECGACTVIVDGVSVCSCLSYAVDFDGRKIETIEGVQSDEGLDPIQQAFVDYGAVQCGYCTPGMVMQVKHTLDKNPNPTKEEIQRGLEGNVCRCTGYSKIIDAVTEVASS